MKRIFLLILLLLTACQNSKYTQSPTAENIRINQIGYYTFAPKIFVVVNSDAEKFQVIDKNNEKVFSGELVESGTWDKSGEACKTGDFSEFQQPGTFQIFIPETGLSYPFNIHENLYQHAFLATAKSYFFQRCSMPIDERYAGVYARATSFPDDKCLFHPDLGKRKGTLSSPGGWFDAGDYGKYVVNAGISVSMLMLLHEIYPKLLPDNSILIPERDNGTNDLLDEIRYEMNWVLTMQDKDGGVFHKLTTLNFQPFVMPDSVKADRYVIGKSTEATLAFAGMCAQASRVFNETDPKFAKQCEDAAEKAWQWAQKNPKELYKNPADVVTGPYASTDLDDQFFYTAAQMYVTTGGEEYYRFLKHHDILFLFKPGENWRNYLANLAYYVLATVPNELTPRERRAYAERIVDRADDLLLAIEANPYRQPLEHFEWGSNSDVADLALIFIMAYQVSDNLEYLKAAFETVDYLFGKNALGVCFLTGFGSKSPMQIHHRISAADGVDKPIPGFLVGGPNADRQDSKEFSEYGITYDSTLPAKSWMDLQASYASNEICINWNAPLVLVLGYFTGAEMLSK